MDNSKKTIRVISIILQCDDAECHLWWLQLLCILKGRGYVFVSSLFWCCLLSMGIVLFPGFMITFLRPFLAKEEKVIFLHTE